MSDKQKALKDLLDEEWNKAIEEAAREANINSQLFNTKVMKDYLVSRILELKKNVGK